jgi:hypothetical protein
MFDSFLFGLELQEYYAWKAIEVLLFMLDPCTKTFGYYFFSSIVFH